MKHARFHMSPLSIVADGKNDNHHLSLIKAMGVYMFMYHTGLEANEWSSQDGITTRNATWLQMPHLVTGTTSNVLQSKRPEGLLY
jgi:hypothetical protein